MTPILREIAENHVEEEITEQANDLLVVILTRTTVLAEKTKSAHGKVKGDNKGTEKKKQGLGVDWIKMDAKG